MKLQMLRTVSVIKPPGIIKLTQGQQNSLTPVPAQNIFPSIISQLESHLRKQRAATTLSSVLIHGYIRVLPMDVLSSRHTLKLYLARGTAQYSLSIHMDISFAHFFCKPTPLQQLPLVCPSSMHIHMGISCASQPPCNNYLQLVLPVCPSIWTFILQGNPHATTISIWSPSTTCANRLGPTMWNPGLEEDSPHATSISSWSF